MEYSNLFVVLFGMGTVFVGLICIIILITLIGYFCNLPSRKETAAQDAESIADAAVQGGQDSQVSGKLAAILTAAAVMHEQVDISQVKEIRIRRVGQ